MLPCPDADREIALLKPPETAAVIVEAPDEFRATAIDVGEAETVNPADTAEVTVSWTVAV